MDNDASAGPPLVPISVVDDLESLLSGPARAVRDLVLRQAADIYDGRIEQPNQALDPSIVVLEDLVQSIQTGQPLDGIQDEAVRLMANQEERVALVKNLVATHNYARLAKFMRARAFLENFLVRCAERGDLTATEALVLLKMVNTEMTSINDLLETPAPAIADVPAMVNKVDYAKRATEQKMASRFGRMTPQGREIIRKMLHRIQKQATEEVSDGSFVVDAHG